MKRAAKRSGARTRHKNIRRLKSKGGMLFSPRTWVASIPGLFKNKKFALISLSVVLGIGLLVQVFYPNDRMLPFAVVDGMRVGGMKKIDASAKLNAAYAAKKLDIMMGDGKQPFASPTLVEMGAVVDNTARLANTQYEWYKRLLPLSLIWGQTPSPVSEPIFSDATDTYIDTKLMAACQLAPVNASLTGESGELRIIPAKSGSQCERDDVARTVRSARPELSRPVTVRVEALKVLEPTLDDKDAEKFRDTFKSQIGEALHLKVGDEIVRLPAAELVKWLDFTVKDETIMPAVSVERSADFFGKHITPKIVRQPGVSRVTTLDFTEVSRQDGTSGAAVNIERTLESITGVITGANSLAETVVQVVPPKVEYTRTYSSSDAGLSALLENYAKDHSGTFGVSLAELSGSKRRASYNGDKQFVTASTYKLFVGYNVLKRVESGKLDWASHADCFNKMLSLSDNPCAESFLQSGGLGTVTNEMKSLGLNDSTFMKSGGPYTTANDLAKFMGFLESGTSLTGESRSRMLSALRANVHRRGIPVGAEGQVADKVGFMNGLLHDAAIVYSPRGTYVLAIMSDGSSWDTIADFTRQIDTQLSR